MTTDLPSTSRRNRAARPRWRPEAPLALLLLGGVFATALLAPIPAGPNSARAEVVEQVESKLPGWDIVRTDASWEGAWSVVAACGPDQLGFQFVPGHGLAPGDAWIQPEDGYSRMRLRTVSDHSTYMLWFDEHRGRTLPCRSELARPQNEPKGGVLD